MLANNILILGLAAIASAQSFVGFAAGGITCETGVSATQDEVVAAMVGPKGTLTEKRADNLATRGCNKVKAPLFKVSVQKKFILSYAFDKPTNTYTLCSVSIGGTGRGPQCSAKP
ncbi:hypothetical protein MCOR27_002338 [Pyricularia oryzae]|uniref:Uncharacterized protein n=2 Tax=Pyricularia TaxID=48558 RepID=A0ABQ8NK70_PYRGI|nr:hypothetical protein MCOR01_009548 [Pyricularia oryzae]KAI6298323.1 hypothetical protein MCOR33_005490 [Pyricularia grisea]KAH9437180.1 hypothetical protein MCOR02_000835 [Pyricularia oryzae]KAI6260486.1 hypothetical protein MCOR19_003170 [Pyricularia oryzae]KAI6269111.1 hypothetical protein MCOR26_008876 [Pyricularia oryzae]